MRVVTETKVQDQKIRRPCVDRCVTCGADSTVKDSRPTKGRTKDYVRRRRECINPKCKRRWTTYEVFEDDIDRRFLSGKTRGRLIGNCQAVINVLKSLGEGREDELEDA